MNYKNIWSILIFTFSSQIGSGMFLLPSFLYEYGIQGLFILGFVGIISILISIIFAETGLSSCDIILEGFGKNISKYMGRLYWFISWFSTIIVIKELSGYLFNTSYVSFEISIVLLFIVINLKNTHNLIIIESIFTFLKIIPVLVLAYCYTTAKNTYPMIHASSINLSVFLKCLWCFVGMENGSIISGLFNANLKERKTGVYLGMCAVIIFYLMSVFFVIKLGGPEIFHNSRPYRIVFQKYFANSSNVLLFSIVSVVLGCINSWILSSGYLGYQLAKSKILPAKFLITNQQQVPYVSIIISGLLIIPFLFLKSGNLYNILVKFVDFSSLLFLLIYAMCVASYGMCFLKKMWQKFVYITISIFIFCFFIWEVIKIILIN